MIKYINVIAKMEIDGIPKPIEIIWENGKSYNISKITDIRKKASTKGGGAGLRYTCIINDKERFLFLVDYKWLIEID